MHRNYIIEALFILLGLALLLAIINYPRVFFIDLPLGILKFVFRTPLLILEQLGISFESEGEESGGDRPYRATRKRQVNFAAGTKYIMILATDRSVFDSIADFLSVLTVKFNITDFDFRDTGQQTTIRCPSSISFYDFHLLTQHINGEFGENNSFGIFISSRLRYCVFQDPNSLNNMIGFTTKRELFSIHMLDDLDKRQYLRINPDIEINGEWMEQVNRAIAENERELR